MLAGSLTAGCLESPDDGELEPATSQTGQDLYMLTSELWPSGPIPVCWETSGSASDKGIVRDAVERTWQSDTAATFSGWGDCLNPLPPSLINPPGVRIKISDERPHTTGLGTQIDRATSGLVLNFTFANWRPEICQVSEATRVQCIKEYAVHEFGHVLGASHEQNRADTPSTCTSDKNASGDGDTVYGAFDWSSVMAYRNPLRHNGGRLSGTDIAGMSHYYGGAQPYAVVHGAAGHIDVFYRRFDSLFQKWTTDGVNWSSRSFTGVITSEPSAVASGGLIYVFARGYNGNLVYKVLDGTTSYGWQSLGGVIVGPPTAIASGANRIDVFVKDVNYNIQDRWFDGTSWQAYNLLTPTAVVTGNLSAASWGAGRLDVVAREDVGNVVHYGYNGTWARDTLVTGNVSSPPTIVSWGSNHLDMFWKNSSGTLRRREWNGVWNAPQILTGSPRSTVAASAWGVNHIDVTMHVPSTDEILNDTFNGTSWSGTALTSGADALADPSSTSWGVGRTDVFYRGSDNAVWHTWFDSGA